MMRNRQVGGPGALAVLLNVKELDGSSLSLFG